MRAWSPIVNKSVAGFSHIFFNYSMYFQDIKFQNCWMDLLVFDTSRRLRRVKFGVKTMFHLQFMLNQQLLLLLMDSIAPKIGKLWRKKHHMDRVGPNFHIRGS